MSRLPRLDLKEYYKVEWCKVQGGADMENGGREKKKKKIKDEVSLVFFSPWNLGREKKNFSLFFPPSSPP